MGERRPPAGEDEAESVEEQPRTLAERLRVLAAAAESGADAADTLGDIVRHTRAFAGLKLGALAKRVRERSKK